MTPGRVAYIENLAQALVAVDGEIDGSRGEARARDKSAVSTATEQEIKEARALNALIWAVDKYDYAKPKKKRWGQ